ncbi:MAG: pantoate--beta-alanine ligase [Idiomarina sp.]|uniref:pantoate--beta-alanine ligase n=1 Tax=Idiomarina sp. TaxID=1874361 RepID=UPI000C5AEE17|nr:pantoate--beta-alanine ligase [Idiomarina sp.]MAK72136.1 pantoate--beta-alanine ligase [Idiomarinaceae bacterium]MBT43166.1 pantoate--beta-alanine ligase [Idiomarina sp.]
MRLLKNLANLRQWRVQQQGSVALVPTMGNLHEGHLTLVKRAQQHADVVVVSIFVNPMQFGANEDLDSYPRTLEQDCRALEALGVNAVFTPQVEDMYPRGMDQQTRIEVPGISDILCGANRPGHFVGVATVVCKLFNMVQPQFAVFGEKDFQQLQVIRLMTQDLSLPIDIIGEPTARAETGLALSSRNGYLSESQREQAAVIYRTLAGIAEKINAGTSVEAARQWAVTELETAGFAIDYVEIRNANDLQPASATSGRLVALIAAKLGSTRLIDNLVINKDHP